MSLVRANDDCQVFVQAAFTLFETYGRRFRLVLCTTKLVLTGSYRRCVHPRATLLVEENSCTSCGELLSRPTPQVVWMEQQEAASQHICSSCRTIPIRRFRCSKSFAYMQLRDCHWAVRDAMALQELIPWGSLICEWPARLARFSHMFNTRQKTVAIAPDTCTCPSASSQQQIRNFHARSHFPRRSPPQSCDIRRPNPF